MYSYEANRIRHLRYKSKYPDRVRESSTLASRRWRANNPEKALEQNRLHRIIRRTREYHVGGGGVTLEQWHDRCSIYLWRCAYCAKALTLVTASMDHVIAVVKGGMHTPANIVPACFDCNQAKRTALWLPKIFGNKERKLPA